MNNKIILMNNFTEVKVHLLIKKLNEIEPDIVELIKMFIIPKYAFKKSTWITRGLKINYWENNWENICIIDREYDYKNFNILYSYCYNGGLSEGYIYEHNLKLI